MTSRTVRAQFWLWLPTRRISPLRTYQTVPFDVAQPRDAQADGLDRAGGLAEVDRVADAVLVLEDHEDARQEVLDQVLGAEAQGDAGDAGTGEQRRDRQAEHAQHHDERDAPDRAGGDAAQQRAHGLGALAAALARARAQVGQEDARLRLREDPRHGALRGASGEPVDEAVGEPAQHHGDEHDEQGSSGHVEQPTDEVLGRPCPIHPSTLRVSGHAQTPVDTMGA